MVGVPRANELNGQSASVSLVYDGNNFGAIRLTITHYRGTKISADILKRLGAMQQERGYASAAFFVRVFSDLDGNANVMPMLHPWNLL